MDRSLFQVILKFGSAGEQLYNVFAFNDTAVLLNVRRLYPSMKRENISISLAVGGYTGIEKDYPQYKAVD